MHRRQDWNVRAKIEIVQRNLYTKVTGKRIRSGYYVMFKEKFKRDCKEVADLATANYRHKIMENT